MRTRIAILDPSYEPVLQEFEKNLTDREDLGSSLVITNHGHVVVDISADDHVPGSFQVVRSISKAVTAMLVWILHDRGEIDVDAPLASVWPELVGSPSEAVTVRQVLAHTSGLAELDESIDVHDILAGQRAAQLMPRATPAWEPGTANGYHDLSFGVLLGEVVARVTGRSVGEMISERLARPLDLNLWLGVPEGALPSVRCLVRDRSDGPRRVMPSGQPEQRPGPDLLLVEHTPEYLTAEVASANVVADAQSLCELFAAFVSTGPNRLVSPDTLADATTLQSEGDDMVVGWPRRYASGFMLPDPTRPMGGEGRGTFGHYGQGGSLAFAHAKTGLAFAYLTRRDRGYPGADPRTAELAARALDCAGVSR